MGQLPARCVTPARPFLHSDVDYAGPFITLRYRGRGAKTYKSFLVVFVCLVTSAVHLELATDYTSAAFIAAYKRFTGRRGICATLTSDCGTNLVGADLELRRLFSLAHREVRQLAHTLSQDGTEWRFNPPGAPHFGGKWEAVVKSAKHHLRRTIGDTKLTYEEFTTLLSQIEAILNSRPICALTDDPSDLSVLTPGHFLIGEPLTTIPEPSLEFASENRLSLWQHLRKMTTHFWQRWSKEHLPQLLPRKKWPQSTDSIQSGALVLIRNERYPPSKWPLARVIETAPGKDRKIRIVTLRTATTTLVRPVTKLCVLPLASAASE